ncbi:MAG: tyrosine-type recombinase/integrase [Coriobacteriales bacterium]|nr:tyrosine-type recombinase/integrase [Coriobacteriales bacterium]
MAKGDGSITEIKRGVWRVCISRGIDPITKKRIKVQQTVRGTKAEARKVRDKLRADLDGGLAVDANKMTFGEFADQWLKRRKESGEYAENTIKSDTHNVKVLKDYLNDVLIVDIKPMSIDWLYGRIRDERELSNTSMNHIHKTLSQILKQAVDFDLLLKNPCDRVKAPKRCESERESLSSAEACRLLECIDEAEEGAYAAEDAKEARQTEQKKYNRGYIVGITDIACAVAARLGLATGARRGEVLAVKRGAVNAKKGYVDILESISPSMKVTKPKNRKTRRVYLDAKTVESLSRWMDYQVSELAKIKKKVDDNAPVFSDAKGGYLNPSNFSRWWRNFTDLNGFHGLCFHELRHTQATQLLANGVDVKTVQTRLGHAKASITLDMYTHAVPQNDQAAADLVGKLFASNAGEDEQDRSKRLSA